MQVQQPHLPQFLITLWGCWNGAQGCTHALSLGQLLAVPQLLAGRFDTGAAALGCHLPSPSLGSARQVLYH